MAYALLREISVSLTPSVIEHDVSEKEAQKKPSVAEAILILIIKNPGKFFYETEKKGMFIFWHNQFINIFCRYIPHVGMKSCVNLPWLEGWFWNL